MNLLEKRQTKAAVEEDKIVDLVEALQRIDTTSPQAKSNETSISDNSGGRIVL